MLVSLRFGEWAFVTPHSWTVASSNIGYFGEGEEKRQTPRKARKPRKIKLRQFVIVIVSSSLFWLLFFNSGSSLSSVPAGIKLHRLEEARLSFLTARMMLHHFRQSLLFPPFTWAAAAPSAAAGAAAAWLPALRPGLADSKLSRLHIAKEEERWSRVFFYWFWKPRVAICDDFGVFCGGGEGGERKSVNLGQGGWKLKEILCKVIQCSTRASATRIQPLLLQRINMGKSQCCSRVSPQCCAGDG